MPDDARTSLHIHRRGDPSNPLQGVFATRTQNRPNPLGLAVVPLLRRRGNRLRVRGLDAIHGTPVLDIKPYVPYYDCVPDARLPEWTRARGREYWLGRTER
ncbi:MAG: TrmO family methyltransferase [Dehalococcoidia bacterium]